MNQNKIAFFHPDGGLNNNPNLNAFLNILVENGFQVDVWSKFDKANSISFPNNQNINYFFVQAFSELEMVVSDYCFSIGVDLGIVYAAKLAKILNIQYGFISYEIYFDDELILRSDKLDKQKARDACKDISFAIVQDKLRAGILVKEYAINREKILFMPVAGDGSIPYHPSKFLHDHLKLNHSTNILLHFGSTLNWTMVDWAISKADTLPENWVMVIHNKSLNHTGLIDHPKVFRSNLPALPLDQLQKLIQSATCSLGLYTAVKGSIYTEKNIAYMGLSSGKIILSLQHGVPVIINQRGELSELIEKYKAGVVLDVNTPMPFSCLNNLTEMGPLNLNCHQLFNEHLDIRNFMDKVLKLISMSVSINKVTEIEYKYYKSDGEKLLYNFNKMPVRNKIYSIFQLFTILIVSLVKKISNNE